jgi:Na+/proline symporter
VKGVLESEYTIFAALLGSTFTTLSTHGTDQDMVQRMLTAENVKKSRLSLVLSGLVDIPIVMIFLVIGILLYGFYQAHPDPNLPVKTNEVFCHFILNSLPTGMRGLLVAGIFATAMGSLSAALNALATSFVRDWYVPYINPQANDESTLKAARRATAYFAALMVTVATLTAYMVILYPKSRIIPIALGIFGYTYGSLLGVFLVGMLTKSRGNDFGNILGMVTGFVAVALLSGLPNDLAKIFGMTLYEQPSWLPVVEFPWRVFFGTLVTFTIAVCFKSKPSPARGQA